MKQESMSPLFLGRLAESLILPNPLENHGRYEAKTNEGAARNIKPETGIEPLKIFPVSGESTVSQTNSIEALLQKFARSGNNPGSIEHTLLQKEQMSFMASKNSRENADPNHSGGSSNLHDATINFFQMSATRTIGGDFAELRQAVKQIPYLAPPPSEIPPFVQTPDWANTAADRELSLNIDIDNHYGNKATRNLFRRLTEKVKSPESMIPCLRSNKEGSELNTPVLRTGTYSFMGSDGEMSPTVLCNSKLALNENTMVLFNPTHVLSTVKFWVLFTTIAFMNGIGLLISIWVKILALKLHGEASLTKFGFVATPSLIFF
jgi:hypothetical protein